MKSITDNLNLSLLEIFSVIFPGGAAILILLQVASIKDGMLPLLPENSSEWPVAILFLGSSYFVGHILFYFGSWLDSYLYDSIKLLLYKPKSATVFKLAVAESIEKIPGYSTYFQTEGTKHLVNQIFQHYTDKKKWKLISDAVEPYYELYKRDTFTEINTTTVLKELVILDDKLEGKLQFSNNGCFDNDNNSFSVNLHDIQTLGWWKRYDMVILQDELHTKDRIGPLLYSEKLRVDMINAATPLLEKAIQIKNKETGLSGSDVINLFKWADAKLMAQYPAMHNVVERHQAASKFFRSMILVFVIAIPVFWYASKPVACWIALLLLAISLLNYLQQRFKAVRTAYEYVVVTSTLHTKPQHQYE